MNALVTVAMVLVIIWAVLSIVVKATGFVINILLLAAIVLLAWWALRRVF
jgi:hypothetical protein